MCWLTKSSIIPIGTKKTLNKTEESDYLNEDLSTANGTAKGDFYFHIVNYNCCICLLLDTIYNETS